MLIVLVMILFHIGFDMHLYKIPISLSICHSDDE